MAEKKQEEQKKPLNLALILQMAFMVLNFAGMGAASWMVYSSTLGWHAPEITEAELASMSNSDADDPAGEPLYYTMDKLTVNLAGEPKRTIRVEVNLEMLTKDGYEEVMTSDNRAIARDKIIALIGDKTYSDLESIQGKLFLKSEIASLVNHVLDKGVVRDVHFSEFVVQ